MLRSNLATRPFYNERLVKTLLVVALAAVALWTAMNTATLYSLSRRNGLLADEIRSDGLRASAARNDAATVRRGLDAAELRTISGAASEASALIQRRTFSWTLLFNQLETTLPADVRLVQVQPQTDTNGRLMVSMTVVSRRIEDLDEFIGGLERTGSFSGVVSRTDEALEDGTLESSLQGYYTPAAKAPAPASEPSVATTATRPGADAR